VLACEWEIVCGVSMVSSEETISSQVSVRMFVGSGDPTNNVCGVWRPNKQSRYHTHARLFVGSPLEHSFSVSRYVCASLCEKERESVGV